MSTGKYGTEEIQKAVERIDEVIDDVQKAREPDSQGGKKITFSEGLGLVVQDSGKVVKLVNAADLILLEIKDLESEEAPQVIEAFKKLYSPENPYIESGATLALEGGLKFKEAGEEFAKAKQWEKENK